MIAMDRIKPCSKCHLVLPADTGAELSAGFWVAQRYEGGRIRFQAWCKDCQRARARRHQAKMRRRAGIKANPPSWLVVADDGSLVLWRRCKCGVEGPCSEGPESLFPVTHHGGIPHWRPWCRDCYNRRRRARYRLRGDLDRLDKALRRMEEGIVPRPRRGTVVDATSPREPAAPFIAWLRAYGAVRGFGPERDEEGRETWRTEALAIELGLVERRVRSLLAGEQAHVSVDVVSRALTEARIVVSVAGRLVVTLDDLMGSEPIRG